MERLKELGIHYELVEHAPAFTMEEYNALGFNPNDEICKNLFLRDYKGTRHMLVVLKGSKHADLRLIQAEVESSKLSFASDKRLEKYLDVKKVRFRLWGLSTIKAAKSRSILTRT